STDPLRKIRAPQAALITQVLVANEDTVEAGKVLLVYNSQAKVEDVLSLEQAVMAIGLPNEEKLLKFNPGKDLLLGSLQDNLYQFFKKQEALTLEKSRKSEKIDVSQLRQKIRIAQRTIEYAKKRRETLEREYLLAREEYLRQDNLFHTNLTTLNKLKEAETNRLEKERGLQSADSDIQINQGMIELLRKEINGVERSSSASENSAFNDLHDEFVRLQKAIETWKGENLAVAPTSGIVLITNENVRPNSHVQREEDLMVVVPSIIKENIARINLNPYGSGKVQVGQKVIIKLKSYPFEEFGALTGKVDWKGKIPVNNTIPIEVIFPEGLITNTGYHIENSQEMVGSAEIITDQKRLIEWIFESFKRVTS
ncbi:MAG: HlyD family efflux transporter periplasmic adaptor subunit, partial [Bdellovibrionales bacterium]|nr:HlyD family efflux transporter periplasmic adaptor subunit [Bdellovibrionales bacterium]